MASLEERDFRRLLDAVRELHTARTSEEFAHVVMRLLPQLVAAEYTSYNEVDLRRNRFVGLIEPAPLSAEELTARLTPHLAEHPLITHMNATGDGTARKISDFLSIRDFHRTALYNEFFRTLALEDQMSIGLISQQGGIIGLTLNRGRRSFKERDRLLLNMLRPHLQQAHENALALSHLQNLLAAQGGLWEQMAGGIILLQPDERCAFCSDQALHWLREYFGFGKGEGALPVELRSWLAAHRAALRASHHSLLTTPFCIARDNKRLLVRHLIGFDGHDVLLLDEEIVMSPQQMLQALGLTPRQAEVLYWLAQGYSNAQIAARLKMSQHTVKRHIEAIFDRLQVEHRHAATHRALQAMGLRPPESPSGH